MNTNESTHSEIWAQCDKTQSMQKTLRTAHLSVLMTGDLIIIIPHCYKRSTVQRRAHCVSAIVKVDTLVYSAGAVTEERCFLCAEAVQCNLEARHFSRRPVHSSRCTCRELNENEPASFSLVRLSRAIPPKLYINV